MYNEIKKKISEISVILQRENHLSRNSPLNKNEIILLKQLINGLTAELELFENKIQD